MVERGALPVDHIIEIRGLYVHDVTQRIDAGRIGHIGGSLGPGPCAIAHLGFVTHPINRDWCIGPGIPHLKPIGPSAACANRPFAIVAVGCLGDLVAPTQTPKEKRPARGRIARKALRRPAAYDVFIRTAQDLFNVDVCVDAA